MSNGNLLIVDDEPIILKRVKLSLKDDANVIYTAENGVEALKILSEQEVHCVVCDINMPKMNGVELLKKVRSENNDVPFIFYTAYGDQKLMLEAAKYGAYDFIEKPDVDSLEAVIKKGLSEGFHQEKRSDSSESEFSSEYRKILSQISKSD